VLIIQKTNQFAAANALLQSFPQSTTDDQYFVQVQTINTARLADPEFVLSSVQEAMLQNIAELPTVEAGYAQSLLGLLKGQMFMPRVPDLGGERNNLTSIRLGAQEVLQVSPNPVSHLLQVQVSAPLDQSISRTLELRALATGNLVRSVRVQDGSAIFISVQDLPSGLYLLILQDQGVVIERKKIAIQR